MPSKLNRYKRAGTKAVDNKGVAEEDDDDDEEGDDGDKKTSEAAAAIDNSLEDGEGEGDVGGGAGLTVIKIRLFKEVKKDEASAVKPNPRVSSMFGVTGAGAGAGALCCRQCTIRSC